MSTGAIEFVHQILHVDGISCEELARQYATPCYLYSQSALERNYRALQQAIADFDATVFFAVKANSNLTILSLMARWGLGFDIVSGGELARVLAAGGQAEKVIFSGVGKSSAEIRTALQANIHCLNIESAAELARVQDIARQLDVKAPVALRVNPDVDAHTHPYISTGLRSNKFGIAWRDALALARRTADHSHTRLVGLACHIGSQIIDPGPLAQAAERMAQLADDLHHSGIVLQHLDLGGGIGVRYQQEQVIPVNAFVQQALAPLRGRREKIYLEPGRGLVANCGVLLTYVEYLKSNEEKNFAVVDAAMNDLLRPALYQSWHEVLPVRQRNEPATLYDVVGPICESGDWLARDRQLAIQAGDLLAITDVGAYGMTMSSNYNSRPRAAEVLVTEGRSRLIRRRETLTQLWRDEQDLLAQ